MRYRTCAARLQNGGKTFLHLSWSTLTPKILVSTYSIDWLAFLCSDRGSRRNSVPATANVCTNETKQYPGIHRRRPACQAQGEPSEYRNSSRRCLTRFDIVSSAERSLDKVNRQNSMEDSQCQLKRYSSSNLRDRIGFAGKPWYSHRGVFP